MTEHTAPQRRTIEIPVRGALITLVVAAAVTAVIGVLWWLSAMAPLSSGASGTAIVKFGAGKPTVDTGTVFAWKRGGLYRVTLWLHNSSSLPVTVTGAESIPPNAESSFSGPTLNLTNENWSTLRPFHPVRIAADGSVPIVFTFHADPHGCRFASRVSHGVLSTDSVTVHFQQVPGFAETQRVPLGDYRFGVAQPTTRACA